MIDNSASGLILFLSSTFQPQYVICSWFDPGSFNLLGIKTWISCLLLDFRQAGKLNKIDINLVDFSLHNFFKLLSFYGHCLLKISLELDALTICEGITYQSGKEMILVKFQQWKSFQVKNSPERHARATCRRPSRRSLPCCIRECPHQGRETWQWTSPLPQRFWGTCIFGAGSGRHRPPTSWPSLADTRPPEKSSAGWTWSAVTPGVALLGHQLRQPYLLRKAVNPDDRRWSLFIFVANCTLNCVALYATVSESQALVVGLWHLGRCCRFWSKMHSSKWLPTLPLRHLSSLSNTFSQNRLAWRICFT